MDFCSILHGLQIAEYSLPGLGKIGYVANSPYTVLGESYSAGRLYDKISEEASGKVKFKLDKGVICELIEQ